MLMGLFYSKGFRNMNIQSGIFQLCTTHTSLSDDDISILIKKSKTLQMIADLAQGNVFIDCATEDPQTAIVVAEAVPTTAPSLYKDRVVGKKINETYEPAVFKSYRTGKPVMVNRAMTHEGSHVCQNVTPIKNEQNATIGMLILETDITSQVEQENELAILSETTAEFGRSWDIVLKEQMIPDYLEEALILLSENGIILYANNFAVGLIQEHGLLSTKQFINQDVLEVLPFVKETDFSHRGISQREVRSMDKVFILRAICLPRKETDSKRILLYIRDITDLRDKERQLMVNQVVIKEIHHRVKNNLQTVASLLRMQMRRGVPEEVKQLYQESLNRISSIAAVHEVLSYSGIEKVNMNQIIQKITKGQTFYSHQPDCLVHIHLNTEDIELFSEQAVSLALIVTELIQNSMKHAFKGRSEGNVTIQFRKSREMIELGIVDDGVGITQNTETDHLGIEIVKNLTHYDLDGTFVFQANGEQGTKAMVTFPFRKE
jgi:two-component system, sensor histidine kinase PdtaS